MKKLFFFLLFSWSTASAQANKGLEILLEADRRSSGFIDYSVNMEMVLRNRQKEENHRFIRSLVLEVGGDGDKSLTIFDSPKDIRGTALLTYSHKKANDDQWLFLPALKRVKRISSANQSGSFMGSEFAFEDLGSREVEKFESKYLKNETIQGQDCFVVELYPKDKKHSGYSRIVSWLDSQEYRIIKEDYFDKRGKLKKTLNITEYQRYLGNYWKPHRLQMVNHQNGKETDLLLSHYLFHRGYTAKDFTKNSLKRLR